MLGSYTHKPRERRYFAAIYLMMRIAHVYFFISVHPLIYPIGACYIWIAAIIVVAIFRPYRNKYHDIIDIVMFVTIFHVYMMILAFLEGNFVYPIDAYSYSYIFYTYSAYFSLLIPPLYGLMLLIWKLLPLKFTKMKLALMYTKLCFRKKEINAEIEESLPYRLKHNSEKYFLLIDEVVKYNGH